MALIATGAAASALALSAYLDAKYHIRNDLSNTTRGRSPANAIEYITQKTIEDRLLQAHILEERGTEASTKDNVFLVFPADGRQWTYAQFWREVCQTGNWLKDELGVRKNELVAINGGNSPEYLMLWFGLDVIGACPAFINCHLTGQALVHCVKLSNSRYMICDNDVRGMVEPSIDEFEKSNIQLTYYSPQFFANVPYPTSPPDPSLRSGHNPSSLRSLIYTSGTTGLPKGTIMVTGRELYVGHSVAKYLDLKHSDRFYTCMPLYHGAAHGLCITPVLHAGASVALGRKFSHSTLWPEVYATGATHLQYVGELCRYLLAAPPTPLDTSHKVQMAWGNGLRPDIWGQFRTRFNIPIINELYAATDGMGGSFNANKGDFSLGAIGVRGALWQYLRGAGEVRVKIDVDSQEILRDAQGFAIKCKTDEAGEVLHVLDPAAPKESLITYYGNPTAGEKRLIRDVFRKGDLWFRSGDMMRQDHDGRVYFVDRLGDTFRWKSENVATNEVEDLLSQYPGIEEINAYGVLVPHADGRAGCAAVVFRNGINADGFDWKGFSRHAIDSLPRYAVPVFVRVLSGTMDVTGTLKRQKGKLRAAGCDLERVDGDRMFWLKPGGDVYVPFVPADWESVKRGGVKL